MKPKLFRLLSVAALFSLPSLSANAWTVHSWPNTGWHCECHWGAQSFILCGEWFKDAAIAFKPGSDTLSVKDKEVLASAGYAHCVSSADTLDLACVTSTNPAQDKLGNLKAALLKARSLAPSLPADKPKTK